MDTLPLPPRPEPAQYRERAEALVAAAGSGDQALRAWAQDLLETALELTGEPTLPFLHGSFERAVTAIRDGAHPALTLPEADSLVAEAYGFASWDVFARHLERLSGQGDPFEAAADAVVGGDLATLE